MGADQIRKAGNWLQSNTNVPEMKKRSVNSATLKIVQRAAKAKPQCLLLEQMTMTKGDAKTRNVNVCAKNLRLLGVHVKDKNTKVIDCIDISMFSSCSYFAFQNIYF